MLGPAVCAGFCAHVRAHLYAYAERCLSVDACIGCGSDARSCMGTNLAERVGKLAACLDEHLDVARDALSVRYLRLDKCREVGLKGGDEIAHFASVHGGHDVDLRLRALGGELRVGFAAPVAVRVCARALDCHVALRLFEIDSAAAVTIR
jgi:hypothetical protein